MKVSSTDVKDLHYQYQKEKEEEKPEPGIIYYYILKNLMLIHFISATIISKFGAYE